MIDLYCCQTPNGQKIIILLEECLLYYRIHPIYLCEQDSIKIEPFMCLLNNRVPVIVDNDPVDKGQAITVFGSSAILLYIAEKTGKFLPVDVRSKKTAIEWLMLQMSNIFQIDNHELFLTNNCTDKNNRKNEIFITEKKRLYRTLNNILKARQYIAGNEYSIADIAAYPWIALFQHDEHDLDEYIHLKNWFRSIECRPATVNAISNGGKIARLSSIPRHIERAILYLNENIREEIMIEDLARYACTSVRNIQLGFKAHKKVTPMQYLREIRLDSARKELLQEEVRTPWQRIALSWGFADVKLFSKYYKERFGETPFQTQYKIKGPLR